MSRTGLVAHEGQHAADGTWRDLKYVFSKGARVNDETPAWSAESLVFKGFNRYEPWGLWNPSWLVVDGATKAEETRRIAVRKAAEEEVYGTKKK